MPLTNSTPTDNQDDSASTSLSFLLVEGQEGSEKQYNSIGRADNNSNKEVAQICDMKELQPMNTLRIFAILSGAFCYVS